MQKLLILATICLITLSCSQEQAATNSTDTPANSGELSPREKRLANVEAEVERLLPQLTLEEKISLLHASGKFNLNAIERLGIHEMWMSDGPHGVRYEMIRHGWTRDAERNDDFSTYLPPLTTVAASWNPEMATLHGNVLGAEARQRNKDIILGPGVNMARLPLYGRNFEYMGEDPYLAATLVVPEIEAIQANDVAATVKHYALNTQELNRNGVDAKPDERTLREVYLPAFEAAVKEGGVWAVMGAYNRYMGTNANQAKHLVMDILKGEWAYQGVLLTDWGADISTYEAAMHGLDIEMGTRVDDYQDYFLAQPLLEMVQSGKVPESVIDDKVRRILRVQLAIGMMDKHRLSGERNSIKHQQDARKIAEEGIVLLKNNNNLLPLDKSIKNILVMGPNADKEHGLGGGSSEVPALYEVTPLQGLKAKLGDDVNITVMRARDESILNPIAPDYVISRHWTGTPAWTLSRFADAAHSESVGGSAVVDSEYQTPGGAQEYVTMTATIRPLTSGVHLLKAQALGDFELKIDGNTVLAFNSDSGETIKRGVELEADKQYNFEINYSGNQRFTLGWDAPGNLFTPEQEYLAAAKQADAVIYFGGLSHGDDREAIDRPDMKLPFQQDAIIEKLLAENSNTVVFLVAGSAVEMPWVNQANAIVWGWYGGMEGGNAFADMLFGDVNPSGKMPITLPEKLEHTSAIMTNDYNAEENLYPEGVFIGYRWFEKQAIEPMFSFGHGLSYTSFEYSDMQLSAKNMQPGGNLEVSVTVKNTGDLAGAEVVQLYLSDKEASVERPAKELKGFAKVWLEPGQSQVVTMPLKQRDLSFWDTPNNDWKAEAGEFEVHIGASHGDIRLSDSFQYQ
jgi:beta-glucosidase